MEEIIPPVAIAQDLRLSNGLVTLSSLVYALVPDDVARYILNRYPRDLDSLFALLDKLDTASLASQRRLTIPFLRQMEGDGS